MARVRGIRSHPFASASQPLVSAIQETYFSGSHSCERKDQFLKIEITTPRVTLTYVSSRDVRVWAYVLVEFCHEALAEAHNLHIGLSCKGHNSILVKSRWAHLEEQKETKSLPWGSKSEPPFAPPMGIPVRAFLKVCSKPNIFIISKFTLRLLVSTIECVSRTPNMLC